MQFVISHDWREINRLDIEPVNPAKNIIPLSLKSIILPGIMNIIVYQPDIRATLIFCPQIGIYPIICANSVTLFIKGLGINIRIFGGIRAIPVILPHDDKISGIIHGEGWRIMYMIITIFIIDQKIPALLRPVFRVPLRDDIGSNSQITSPYHDVISAGICSDIRFDFITCGVTNQKIGSIFQTITEVALGVDVESSQSFTRPHDHKIPNFIDR